MNTEQASCESCGETTEPLFLHGRCHMHAPQFLRRDKGDLCFECIECSKLVWRVRAEQIAASNFIGSFGRPPMHLFAQECHSESAVCGILKLAAELIQVHCYECKKLVGKIYLG